MRRTFIAVASLVAACLFLPGVAAQKTTAIVRVDVQKLLQANGIHQPVANLRALVSDADGTRHGFLIDTGRGISVYRDSVTLYNGAGSACTDEPFLFWMTPDGHLVFTPDCSTLYFDGTVVSSKNLVIKAARESAVYVGGFLIYPEKTLVKKFDPSTKKSKILYSEPGENILFIRAKGDHVAYTTSSHLGNRIYVDGRKVATGIDNPWNFLLLDNGDVYYFSQNGRDFTLWKNDQSFLSAEGHGGFIFADGRNRVWHVSYQVLATVAHIYLGYDNYRNVLEDTIANVEGVMAFQGDHFAARAQVPKSDNFSLLKDGKFIGDKFEFARGKKDFNGLFFAGNGKVYMRNFNRGRWYAYEDGKKILSTVFTNVWLVQERTGGDVAVYGAK